jgi:putative ABC transport system permease protein
VTAPITSLRTLEWDSMRVNFFVIASPGLLDGAAYSDITSFRLPPGQEGFVAALVGRFPNLTVIDVGSVVRQLQDTLGQVTRAVRAVFGFALLAGLAVLYAALQSSADERSRELALMRALGAQGAQLRAGLVAEFALLGGMAWLLATLGSAVVAMALARGVFNLPYVPSSGLFAGGLGGGLVLVVAAGLLGVRPVLRSSPLQALRAAD